MKRRDILKTAALGTAGVLSGVACAPEKKQETVKAEVLTPAKPATLPTYGNDHFYENGKLSAKKTLDAYLEMMEFYNYPVDKFLRENMFISDFSLGDFANAGMCGVFWHNSLEHNYFAHEIYLLPGQMIVEHCHLPTKIAKAKMETWQVRHGSIYTFSDDEETKDLKVKLPESQQPHITARHCVEVKRGEMATLNRLEAKHFMMAGPQGAIVSEYASYHDNDGLKFTNPNVVFNNVLS
ncbi:hypothetical protein FUAX_37100 [Fulvitalea axinellae]|uniref:D-lyxose ketol-isomerase n=1 Tax=Fulvitalea axinellae TaxID=1182444 RepID=A0AAU9CM42_9BACT|nr:hypothetical protein FUAX_37100 [Fulvitalea axinellae]